MKLIDILIWTSVWCKKHETTFPIVGFLIKDILGIVGSQIETKRNFSLIGILTNLRRCRLQLDNFLNLIFVNKNWTNDARVDCKAPSNLVYLINPEINLKQEFK